jgi:hypothetical protein
MKMKWICLFSIIVALIACVDKETKMKEESIKTLEASLSAIPMTNAEDRCVVFKQLFILEPLNKTYQEHNKNCDQLAIEKVKEKVKENVRQEYQKAREQISVLIGKWDDTARIAGRTPRIALANPVSDLQKIKQEVQAVIVPECLKYPRNQLVSGMNMVIEGYLSFMAQETDSKIGNNLSSGIRLMKEYENAASACKPQ